MKKSIRNISYILAVFLLIGLFAGCGQTSGNNSSGSTAAVVSSQSAATQAAAPKYFATGNEKVTLTTIGYSTSSTSSITGNDPNKEPWRQAMEEKTGVHLEYIMTTAEDGPTKFSLLVSSGDLPDFFDIPNTFPGGTFKAASDGLIINIKDYLDKDAPNLKNVLESNPEWMRETKADDGNIYRFPFICEDKTQLVFFGPIIRKDLLDTAGLGVPETIDEWHTALTAFKNQGFKAPFSSVRWYLGYCSAFAGAYGTSANTSSLVLFPDGKLNYGPIQPGYKEYLAAFAQWYREGLLDPDYMTIVDQSVYSTKMSSGQAAAGLGWLSYVNDWNSIAKTKDPKAEFVATKYPVLNKGDKPLFGQSDPPVILLSSISSKCKNIDAAVKYMDYLYTKEGITLANFGIEGESYKLDASGNPVFTELITAQPKNSKGWTQEQAITMYSPASGSYAPGIQQKSSFEQLRLSTDGQKNALNLWADTQLSAATPAVTFTSEETSVTKKLADIDTYVQEMTAKFISGTEPISNFDNFVQRCKQMGIDDIAAVYNKAYDRFMKR